MFGILWKCPLRVYAANEMDSIASAANCVHQCFKNVGVCILACVDAGRGQPLVQLVDAVLDMVVKLHAERIQEWSALIYLERQISEADAYQPLLVAHGYLNA